MSLYRLGWLQNKSEKWENTSGVNMHINFSAQSRKEVEMLFNVCLNMFGGVAKSVSSVENFLQRHKVENVLSVTTVGSRRRFVYLSWLFLFARCGTSRNKGNQSPGLGFAEVGGGEQLNSRIIIIPFCQRRQTNERHTTGTRLMTRQTMETIMLSAMAKRSKATEEWRT